MRPSKIRTPQLTLQDQFAQLRAQGFIVIRGFAPAENLAKLNNIARTQLVARASPLELEVDLRYPGAPQSRAAVGAETIRRLLNAYNRDREFAACATAPRLQEWVEGYFGEAVMLSRVHLNCLMTKHPHFGSLSGWHRDIRFWSFDREDLVSVWIALGEEYEGNGALWFAPGSHALALSADRFDEAKFFRTDRADNAEILCKAESPRLEPGDAVFFHCNTLHSAGQNSSDTVKLSLAFTYHGRSNTAKARTRSSSMPEVELSADEQPG